MIGERATLAGMTLYMKWRDKREVMMLSTFHDDTFEKRRCTRLASDGVVIEKPAVMEDYNLHMGVVDKGKNCSVHRIVHVTIQPTKFMTSADQLWLCTPFHQVVEASVLSHPQHSDSECTYPVHCML